MADIRIAISSSRAAPSAGSMGNHMDRRRIFRRRSAQPQWHVRQRHPNSELRPRLADGDRLKICDLAFTFYRDQPSQRATIATRHGNRARRADAVDDEPDYVGRST